MPEFTITIQGVEELSRQLRAGEGFARNSSPAVRKITDDIFRVIGATFSGQGRRYGGSWLGLDPRYVSWKARKGYDTRKNIKTSLMMSAYTKRGARKQILREKRHEVVLSSTIPYADRNNAKRPFLDFYPQDQVRWARIVENELLSRMTRRYGGR